MLSKKFSTKKIRVAVGIGLLTVGTTLVFAQSDAKPTHNRRPQPPKSRPPEITDAMRRGISPPPYEPSQAMQPSTQIAAQPQPQRTQLAPSTAPSMKPVQRTQPVRQPQAIQVAKTIVQDNPETPISPAKPAASKTPESVPGYIVFVAGLLLLFRKTSDS